MITKRFRIVLNITMLILLIVVIRFIYFKEYGLRTFFSMLGLNGLILTNSILEKRVTKKAVLIIVLFTLILILIVLTMGYT